MDKSNGMRFSLPIVLAKIIKATLIESPCSAYTYSIFFHQCIQAKIYIYNICSLCHIHPYFTMKPQEVKP